MARTPLFSWLQQAASVAAEATTRHVTTSQVIAERAERGLSRRDVLKLAGAAGLTAGVSALGVRQASAAGSPPIVVVGAGLAGLTCAYRLKQAGWAATVYEASSRIGGRCWTIRGAFADGQIAEHGGETTDQSSLNMLYLLGYSGQGNLRIFGPSNEKYRVHGGNDQIPSRLAAQLSRQINLNHALIAINQNTNNTYQLTFQNGATTKTVTADRVVLAIPFSILRTSRDYKAAGFKPLKQTAIQELGMGTNSKLHVQFKSRLWESLGCNGATVADTGYQNTWDVSRAQTGKSGILVDYTGGTIGASFGSGTPDSRAQQFLAQLEPVLPGITARYNGRATLDYWTGYQWTRGSYSHWKVGQYTKFAGVEREPEGRALNCHFAGEHTSIDFQGYLNGGVETGERAADEVIAALR